MLHENYEAVIGLETHVQLRTDAKIFSSDATAYGADPNTNVDPISLGHPGTLPVLNKRVVEYSLRMGLATHCSIAPRAVFARKHYFYPDLPKGYQISQYDTPICYDGYVEIVLDDEAIDAIGGDGPPQEPTKRIGLTRIHMEEDAGKSMHDRDPHDTLIDYNRCGVPLIEIVSEPDLRSAREAYLYLQKVRQLVRYLGISDGNMEEGSLRCDANVSIRPRGRRELGMKTEVKNMNSFRNVERALEYEIDRQIKRLELGQSIQQETLLWDADRGETRPMRSKEEAHDYRYFPDPDLVEVEVDEAMIDAIRADLPEMPDARRRRFEEEMGLPPYDASVLTEERAVADYFEEALSALFKRTKGGNTKAQAKEVSNFVMTEVMRVLNEQDISIDDLAVTPERLAQLVYLRMDDKVSSSAAQEVFEAMLDDAEKSAGKIAEERNLIQVSDKDSIAPVVDRVLDENEDQVETYLSGKDGLFGYFIGQVMRSFDGSPDPQVVRELLKERLDARRKQASS
jgi:aspartyl-tRNA(Asn)/glutamyl-tRNA(Gln) amidotransferase subunit B